MHLTFDIPIVEKEALVLTDQKWKSLWRLHRFQITNHTIR